MKKITRHFIAGSLLCLSLGAGAQNADLARAEEIVGGRCFLCHGLKGESASAVFPRLAGQHYRLALEAAARRPAAFDRAGVEKRLGELSPEQAR